MATLYVRTDAAEWQVWPALNPIPSGSIQETGNYVFELRDAHGAETAELFIDDVALEALRAPQGIARWRWNPGFYAGAVDVELRTWGQAPRRFEIITDPDRRKLLREQFDVMVREILDDTFALFSLSNFRKGVARGSGTKPPPIARLEFLRSRIDQLEAVVASIAASPRRRLTATETVVPYHLARQATGPEIIRSFRSGRALRETATPSRLPSSLNGFLPEKIRTNQKRNSVDIPEHRQMRACLLSWSSWLDATADILAVNNREDEPELLRARTSWSVRCRQLSRRVQALTQKSPFEYVRSAPPRLLLSALFRSDPRYRKFYRVWQDIELGIAAIFGDFLNMPLSRTFELYELWSFLRLARAAADLDGSNVDTSGLWSIDRSDRLTVPAGTLTIAFGSGWRLHFQKEYREFWIEPDGRGSYSRPMRPDIVAQSGDEDGGRVIVLDAKYRIEAGLGDALASIHMYRDAIVRDNLGAGTASAVTAAYILAPYLPDEFGADYRASRMPGRLFHPEYRRDFKFGAVTLIPGMTSEELRQALQTVITDATAN